MRENRTDQATASDDEPAAKIPRVSSKVIDLKLPSIPNHAGNLLCCGQNDVGQLGLGENVSEKTRPAILSSAINVVEVRAGGMHSLYLNKDGEVYSFGCNDEGALGRETTADGSEYTPKKINLSGKCIKISAGDSHSACLLDDGRAFAWGSFRDSHGNMGLTLQGNKPLPIELVPNVKFVDLKSGADHLVLLTNTGKVYTIGCGEQGQLGRVSARSSSGETRRGKTELLLASLVHFKKGKVVDAIWTSTYCTFIREHDTQKIYAFGLNNYNQLGVKKTSEAIFVPKLTNFNDVKIIAGGQHHSLVLTNDNECFAIGNKEYGRLGIGQVKEDVTTLSAIKLLADKSVTQISCGEHCSFALTSDGKVYVWGMGSNNQLGTGSEDDVLEPILLKEQQVKDKDIIAISSGGQHTLFIVADPILSTKVVDNGTKTNGISEKLTTKNGSGEKSVAARSKKGQKKK